MMSQPISVCIVDDHPLMREALRATIESETDMVVVGEAGNGQDAIDQLRTLQVDVLIIDLLMPGMDGLEAIARIKKANPTIKILVMTGASDENLLLPAIQAGALGYLLKKANRSQVIQAVRTISQGNVYLTANIMPKILAGFQNFLSNEDITEEQLTEREIEVLGLVGQGATNREIASSLFLAEGTVRTHIHHILKKLKLKNRNQAILYARQKGYSLLK
jgi:two-component system, NarL family, response regulator LiaR